ncbi:hypothetical protein TKK_0008381 [Trichogramma kaykai]
MKVVESFENNMEGHLSTDEDFLEMYFYWHVRFFELASLSPFQNPVRQKLRRAMIFYYMIHVTIAQIKEILKLFFDDYLRIHNEPELQKALRNGMRPEYVFSVTFSGLLLGAVSLLLIFPYLAPIVVNKYFNTSLAITVSSNGNFGISREKHIHLLFFFTFIGTMTFVSCVVAVSAALMTFIALIVGKFNVIFYRFTELWTLCQDVTVKRDKQTDEHINKIMARIAEDHEFCYEMNRRITDVSQNVLLFILLFVMIAIILSGSMMVINFRINILFCAKMGIGVSAIMSAAFLLSYIGQRLENISDEMINRSYDCAWYNLPTKAQKLLLVIMAKSLSPCELTAGPTIRICFLNFSSLVNTSMSYITVMISLVEMNE